MGALHDWLLHPPSLPVKVAGAFLVRRDDFAAEPNRYYWRREVLPPSVFFKFAMHTVDFRKCILIAITGMSVPFHRRGANRYSQRISLTTGALRMS